MSWTWADNEAARIRAVVAEWIERVMKEKGVGK